jgi:hypothetical protein
MTASTTSKLIETFTASVDCSRNDYTLDELKKLLAEAHKQCKSKKKVGGEKKEPSKYNIFIKEEIARIRAENPSVDNKQLMSLAAGRWKEHKDKLSAAGTETQE